MKKTLILFAIFTIMSFQPAPSYKLEFTVQEVQIIYDALGELPAKTTEQIRAKIINQVNQQNIDKK